MAEVGGSEGLASMTKQMRVRRAAMDLSLLVWMSELHSDQTKSPTSRIQLKFVLWPSSARGPQEHFICLL